MKIYKNVDLDISKKLINYSESIANLYNKLYELEIDDQKDSETYNNYVFFISLLKKKEIEIYNNIPFELLNEYYDYFENMNNLLLETKSPVSKTLFSSSNCYIIIRILNTLNYLSKEIERYNEEEMNKSLDEVIYLSNINTRDITSFNESIDKARKSEDFQEESLNISIIFLSELIKKLKNEEIKKELLKSKYVNAFSNTYIEDDYLSCKFDLSLNIVDISDYKKLIYILNISYKCSIETIKNLFKKEIYTDHKNFVIYLSMLKSYLYFLSDDKIVKLINKLYASKGSSKNFEKIKTKIITEMKDTLKKVSDI